MDRQREYEIKLRHLLWSAFAFAPLPVNIYPNFSDYTGRNQLALFCIFSALLFLGISFFGTKRKKLVFSIVSFLCIISAVNTAYLLLVGNPIPYGAIASIWETNLQELTEFIGGSFFIKLAAITMALLGSAALAGRLKRAWSIPYGGIQFKTLHAVLISGCLTCTIVFNLSGGDLNSYFPFYGVASHFEYAREVQAFVSPYSRLTYTYSGDIDTTSNRTVVLVIGESARRDAHGIYDERLQTNPALTKAIVDTPTKFAVFQDAVSASNHTRVSVPSLLSVLPAVDYAQVVEAPSIVKVLSAAGLETILLSNQQRSGFFDDFVKTIFLDATRKVYLKDEGEFYDEALVPELKAELDRSVSKSRLIVVHLGGSHYRYRYRYPSDHVIFDESTEQGQYLNTIRYTDFVLGILIDLISESDREIALLYTSDHGEMVGDDGTELYGHGYTEFISRSEFEVPLFVTVNDAFLLKGDSSFARIKNSIESPVGHDNISHTILGLMGIRADLYRAEYDLSAPEFSVHPRFTIENVREIYPYADSTIYLKKVQDLFIDVPMAN
jgi:glucan phosphoethanolaminetransferase (alkaline phosphatase superfamily)